MPPRSPISVEAVRRLLSYDRAVFERFERRIRRLPRREAFGDRGIGHLSYFGTLVHILNVHDAWLNYIVPGRMKEFLEVHASPVRHPTEWRGFAAYKAQVWSGVETFAASATDRALSRRVRAPWLRGVYVAGDGVLQVTIEEAHHLGEIIGALWQEDRAPPDMTWIDLENPPKRRARRG